MPDTIDPAVAPEPDPPDPKEGVAKVIAALVVGTVPALGVIGAVAWLRGLIEPGFSLPALVCVFAGLLLYKFGDRP